MKKVYLTVPNGDGWLHKLVHYATIRMLQDRRVKVRHDCPTHRPYENNLHHCMQDFLDHDDDYWISMDTDNPPLKNPIDLIGLDKDVIGLPTPVWHSKVPGDQPYYFNALRWVDEKGGYAPVTSTGLTEVDAVGSGCFIIARRVIEKLQKQQPFQRTFYPNGTVEFGCDYSFCKKAKSVDFKIWTHFDYLCHHFNELNILEVIDSFNKMVK